MATVTPTPAVGLCGCGNMGAAIARRLAGRADLWVYDLDAGRAAGVAAATGAAAAAGPGALADRASTVLLSLPHPRASREVVAQLVAHRSPPEVVVETSTVAPADVRELALLCEPAGVRLVDAAILSGVDQMAQGSATLLVGGEPAARQAAAPVLELLSPKRRELGALGTGMLAKVVNNAVSHAVMVVLIEAVAIAESGGLSSAAVADLLGEPDAGLLRPLTHRLRERVLTGDYEGGMPVELAGKDSALAMRVAQEAGVPLFAIQAAHTPYELAERAGLGRADYAALATLWEQWLGRGFQARDAGGPERA